MATMLQDLASQILKILLIPGEIFLKELAKHAPALAAALGLADNEPSLVILISS